MTVTVLDRALVAGDAGRVTGERQERPDPEVPEKARSETLVVAVALGALAVLAGCGSSDSTDSASGAPVRGGNLVIARTRGLTVDEQHHGVRQRVDLGASSRSFQPLYTVTPNGKGVMPWLATGYTLSPNKLTYTFTLRKGVQFSTGKPMTSADVEFSLDQARAATQGLGLHRRRDQVRRRPHPVHRGDQPQVPVGAAAGRPVAVRQRDRAGQLRRPVRGPVLHPPGRHRAVQVGLLDTRARR